MRKGWMLMGMVLVPLLIVGCSGESVGSSASDNDLCDQSAEAAHYISAKSLNAEDVARVTDEAIADRKYPLIGDKVTASIGTMVALSKGRKTPDEISDTVRKACYVQMAK